MRKIFGFQLALLVMLIAYVGVILTFGEDISLKVDGYDPYDFLRGNYISLELEESWFQVYEEMDGDIYAIVENNAIVYISDDRPEEGQYLRVTDWYDDYDGEEVRICGLADTYYVNQDIAKELEGRIEESDDVRLNFKVIRGNFVIDSLTVDGVRY